MGRGDRRVAFLAACEPPSKGAIAVVAVTVRVAAVPATDAAAMAGALWGTDLSDSGVGVSGREPIRKRRT